MTLGEQEKRLADAKQTLLEKRRRGKAPASPQAAPPIPRLPEDAVRRASFGQERLWVLHQLQPTSAAYNMVSALRLQGALNVEALEQAYLHIAGQPASGSPRHAHELNLPGLRSWPLQRYPYLIFYVERPNHIDIWRVLHGQRDIPAWLHDDTDTSPDTPH